MKKLFLFWGVMIVMSQRTRAQGDEAQQLLLNVAKLAQFKQILSNMKKGYQILNSGYTRIKDLSKGNFDLHKTFLDALLKVSPTVRKYKRIADIISDQLALVKEYRSAYSRFRADSNFAPGELAVMAKIYSNLFDKSIGDLGELAMVMTDGKLRMSDDERLRSIDRVYASIQDKLMFLRNFNNNTTILAVQRARERNDASTLKKTYNIKN